MDTGSNPLRSPWLAPSGAEPWPSPSADVDVDVAVVGGGIVGVSAAYYLAEAGVGVALLEARTLAGGVTGNSTAKLTALHGLIYREITSHHGAETARAYAELSLAGLDAVPALAERYEIECRLERRAALTYAEESSNRGRLEEEVLAAGDAGLEIEYTDETDLPFDVAGAVRVDDQAQFDPVAWTRGLAAAAAGRGAAIHEDTRAVSVSDDGDRIAVQTEAGPRVRAERVVVATHMPFLDRGLHFARLRPERSYAVAGPSAGTPPRGMYLSVEKPTRSIRSFTDLAGIEHVILAGEGHKSGRSDSAERYRRLESDLAERFGIERVDYRWSAHDLVSADQLPFVGRLAPLGSDSLLTACGFNKWGLAAGVGAAAVLRDLVLGRDNALAQSFDPTRLNLRSSLPKLVKENADAGLHFVGDRLKRVPLGDLASGEGRIAGSGMDQVAVHRDTDGVVHRLSARCTHLGCIVAWNDAERTWDCPCHGSRFAATGEVIEGPAVRPLERRG